MPQAPDTFAITPGIRALVTAGPSVIGRAISDVLIAHGAKVHICDIPEVFLSEFSPAHPGVSVSRADVSSEADVESSSRASKASSAGLTR